MPTPRLLPCTENADGPNFIRPLHPAKTTPHRWRKETPTRSGGPPALLSPKRLAWALVKPAEAHDDDEAAAVVQAEQDAETQRVAGLARRFTALVRAAGRSPETTMPPPD